MPWRSWTGKNAKSGSPFSPIGSCRFADMGRGSAQLMEGRGREPLLACRQRHHQWHMTWPLDLAVAPNNDVDEQRALDKAGLLIRQPKRLTVRSRCDGAGPDWAPWLNQVFLGEMDLRFLGFPKGHSLPQQPSYLPALVFAVIPVSSSEFPFAIVLVLYKISWPVVF